MATTAPGQPAGIVAISRAVVSAAADLVAGMERAMAGDGKIRTAQSNAWDAVLADRARAQARVEMNQLVASLVAAPLATGAPVPGRPATGPAGPATSTPAPAASGTPTRAGSGTTARAAAGTTARAAARATARTGTGRAAAARPGQRSVGSSPRSRASHTARVSTGAAAAR